MISVICQSERKHGASQHREFCRHQRKEVFKLVLSGVPVGIRGECEKCDQLGRFGRRTKEGGWLSSGSLFQPYQIDI